MIACLHHTEGRMECEFCEHGQNHTQEECIKTLPRCVRLMFPNVNVENNRIISDKFCVTIQ